MSRWRIEVILIAVLGIIAVIQFALLLGIDPVTITRQNILSSTEPPPITLSSKLDALARFTQDCSASHTFVLDTPEPDPPVLTSKLASPWMVLDSDVLSSNDVTEPNGTAHRCEVPVLRLGFVFDETLHGGLRPFLSHMGDTVPLNPGVPSDACTFAALEASFKVHEPFQYIGAYQTESVGEGTFHQERIHLKVAEANGGQVRVGNRTHPLLWVRFSSPHSDVDVVVHIVYPRPGYWWYGHQQELTPVLLSSLPAFRRAETQFGALLVPGDTDLFVEQASKRLILCDFERARRFRQQFGSEDQSGTASRFRQQAKALLVTAQTVLNALGIPFWIGSGTLLGWFRQCNFIAYSKDVDFGVMMDDYKPELIDLMEAHGLRLTHRFGTLDDSFELSFKNDKGLKLDIFFFLKTSKYYWNGGTQARTGHKFKYRFKPFQLCWAMFLGVAVRVPCDTESYIEANYGVNWFTPVEKWDWKKSPPNVKPNGEWPKTMWPEVIQCDQCVHKVKTIPGA